MDRRRALDILGLTSVFVHDDVREARRLAARRLHPDVGGSVDDMTLVNQAADFLLGEMRSDASVSNEDQVPGFRRSSFDGDGLAVDRPSFVVDVLPVDAFEWIAASTRIIGQIVDEDPPYSLEFLVDARPDRWCRLEIVPDAGSSTVSIIADGHDPSEMVPLFVHIINELGSVDGLTDVEQPPS